MLTETEAKSRALENLAIFSKALNLPPTLTKSRSAHIDIVDEWKYVSDAFWEAATNQASEHGERLIKVLKAGILERLLRILFDFYALAERVVYSSPRNLNVVGSPAVRPPLQISRML